MKKIIVLLTIVVSCVSFITIVTHDGFESIPPTKQRTGNADSGYNYMVTGDYVNSGIPLNLYKFGFKNDKSKLLHRNGPSANVRYDLNVVHAANGEMVLVPNCFQCHAEEFDGRLFPGLGNSNGDFTRVKALKSFEKMLTAYLKLNPKKYEAAKEAMTVEKRVGDDFHTDVVGTNPADRLTALLVAHRDPTTLKWNDESKISFPDEVIPSDVPAWWLLKKKNAMFYNGFGRGDFGKFLMGSVLLTVNDTAHAREVDGHMPDVLSYIYSLEPPKYPKSIDGALAANGKIVFENNCGACHGTYGNNEQYPNLLIPEPVIGTDSLLNRSNYQYAGMVSWYNTSWFSKGDYPAQLVPFDGYIAPPLDGIWITAPYFHNGSVPTVEGVLNSKLRPTYWTRDFDSTHYDYDNLGWQYEKRDQPGNKYVYNTKLPGYGNYGHTFGDHLTDAERKEVIEYLKTL